MTSCYPIDWLTRQIVGDHVAVECPIPAGTDPGEWQPDEETIARYQTAALVITKGAGLESWVTTTTLPRSRVLDCSAELNEPLIQYADVVTHQHGPGGEQTNEGTDPHTWMDPLILKQHAQRVCDAAARQWPAHAVDFRQNLSELTKRLDQLDTQLREVTPALERARLLAAQPAYNYIARRYGWELTNLNLSVSGPLTDDQTAYVKKNTSGTTILLWPEPPSQEVVDTLTSAGITSVVFPTGERKRVEPGLIEAAVEAVDRLRDTAAVASDEAP